MSSIIWKGKINKMKTEQTQEEERAQQFLPFLLWCFCCIYVWQNTHQKEGFQIKAPLNEIVLLYKMIYLSLWYGKVHKFVQ